MKLALIGLPKCGKTMVFNAVVGPHKERQTPSHAAVQNIAVVRVPDERLDFLHSFFPEKRCTPASVELLELVGIFPSPWEVYAESATALAMLREMDLIVEVIRAFPDETTPHPKGSIDPHRDLKDMEQELLLNDLLSAEKRIDKLKKAITKPTPTPQKYREGQEILLRCKEALDKGQDVSTLPLTSTQQKQIRGFCFFTEKPRLVVVNVGEDQFDREFSDLPTRAQVLTLCGKLESELLGLEDKERQEFQKAWGLTEPAGPRLLRACYKTLNLVSFYTMEGDELRVWSIPRGETALTAAGKIHSDIARGFIKAEVMSLADLKTLGSLKEVKAHGKLHVVAKEYIVQDGDIITFRFHV
jgi:GTP-binding protein YchF